MYSLRFGFQFKEILKYLQGRSIAFYSTKRDEVWMPIFAFKYKDKRFVKQEIIFALFHELRHHYQYERKPKLNKRRMNYTIDDWEYNTDPTERDANMFASRMCLKYKKEISRIINVYPDWSTSYYC